MSCLREKVEERLALNLFPSVSWIVKFIHEFFVFVPCCHRAKSQLTKTPPTTRKIIIDLSLNSTANQDASCYLPYRRLETFESFIDNLTTNIEIVLYDQLKNIQSNAKQ